MMLLISTAPLMGEFRIVETVTNLQQVVRGLIGLRHSWEVRRQRQAHAIRDLRPTHELAEDFFAEASFAEDFPAEDFAAEDLGKA
jgi:hypothetical protein